MGEGDEQKLLQQFCRCTRVFQGLEPKPRAVIADVTRRMADGMAEFVGKDLGEGTQTIDEYNRYCYYVAGLVGEGLTRLFHACGYESAQFEQRALDPALVTAQHKQARARPRVRERALVPRWRRQRRAAGAPASWRFLNTAPPATAAPASPRARALCAQGGLDKSMGLFLQKTNIIRDYLEDYVDGRAFWPKEVRGG